MEKFFAGVDIKKELADDGEKAEERANTRYRSWILERMRLLTKEDNKQQESLIQLSKRIIHFFALQGYYSKSPKKIPKNLEAYASFFTKARMAISDDTRKNARSKLLLSIGDFTSAREGSGERGNSIIKEVLKFSKKLTDAGVEPVKLKTESPEDDMEMSDEVEQEEEIDLQTVMNGVMDLCNELHEKSLKVEDQDQRTILNCFEILLAALGWSLADFNIPDTHTFVENLEDIKECARYFEENSTKKTTTTKKAKKTKEEEKKSTEGEIVLKLVQSLLYVLSNDVEVKLLTSSSSDLIKSIGSLMTAEVLHYLVDQLGASEEDGDEEEVEFDGEPEPEEDTTEEPTNGTKANGKFEKKIKRRVF